MRNHPDVEKRLSHLGYREIEAEIKGLNYEELVVLLDSPSRRVGNVAFDLLSRSGQFDLVVERVLDGTIHTRLGKVRATNMLNWQGKRFKRSKDACLLLLQDRSYDVLSNALFGLVFLQDQVNLPAIVAEAQRRRPAGGKAYERLLQAIEAIEKGNPFIYSPHFCDAQGIWQLDQARFPGGTAPATGSEYKQ